MTELDPQRIKDEEHLKLLGVFNYVFAGLCGFGALMFVPHLMMMQSGFFEEAFEQAAEQAAQQSGEQGATVTVQPEAFTTFFTIFIAGWIVVALTAAVLSFLSARFLRSKRSRGFSMVVAGLQCLAVPLGTILGVFTFVVLGRPTVQKAYDEAKR